MFPAEVRDRLTSVRDFARFIGASSAGVNLTHALQDWASENYTRGRVEIALSAFNGFLDAATNDPHFCCLDALTSMRTVRDRLFNVMVEINSKEDEDEESER